MIECAVCAAIEGSALDFASSVVSSVATLGVAVATVAGIVAARGARAAEGMARSVGTVAGEGAQAAEGLARGVGTVANAGAEAVEGLVRGVGTVAGTGVAAAERGRDAFWEGYDRASPPERRDPWWVGTEGVGEELARGMGGQAKAADR